jgi:hypothetical protein
LDLVRHHLEGADGLVALALFAEDHGQLEPTRSVVRILLENRLERLPRVGQAPGQYVATGQAEVRLDAGGIEGEASLELGAGLGTVALRE